MACKGAVHDAAMCVELELGEKGGPAVLVVDAFVVSKEDGTFVVW